MSDPVTNVEIEDVLASIRRLVSEESRPETPVQESPGKLVLTPALRVAEPTGDDDTGGGAAASETVSASGPVAGMTGDFGVEDDYAEDVEEPQPIESADLEARFADMAEDEEVAEVIAVDSHDTFDDAAAAEIPDVKFETTRELPASEDWQEEEPAEAEQVAEWQDEPADTVAMDAPEDDEIDESIEEPEAVEAFAYQVDEGPDPDLEELAELDDDDGSILDEEALRELVADIVRQELQGALGERITRNVRKLVRREIHRALTGQEFQ